MQQYINILQLIKKRFQYTAIKSKNYEAKINKITQMLLLINTIKFFKKTHEMS